MQLPLKFHYHFPIKIASSTHKVIDQEAFEPYAELAVYPAAELA